MMSRIDTKRQVLKHIRRREDDKLTDCPYFINGECPRGNLCKYRHSASLLSSPRITCVKWEQSQCLDVNCAFLHLKKSNQQESNGSNQKLIDCINYLNGHCWKTNEHCKYRHSKTAKQNGVCSNWKKGQCSNVSCPNRHPKILVQETSNNRFPATPPFPASSHLHSKDQKKAIVYFWDIQNCPVPSYKSVFEVVQQLRKLATDEVEESFNCICDINTIPQKTAEQLWRANARLIDPPQHGSYEPVITQEIEKFISTHKNNHSTIVIISDFDYSRIWDISNFKVIRIHTSQAKPEFFKRSAESHEWTQFLQPSTNYNPNSFDCAVCKKVFRSRYFLMKHLENKSHFACAWCFSVHTTGQTFNSLQALEHHTSQHKTQHQCELCNYSSLSENFLKSHKTSSRHFVCHFCMAQFESEEHASQHRVAKDHFPLRADEKDDSIQESTNQNFGFANLNLNNNGISLQMGNLAVNVPLDPFHQQASYAYQQEEYRRKELEVQMMHDQNRIRERELEHQRAQEQFREYQRKQEQEAMLAMQRMSQAELYQVLLKLPFNVALFKGSHNSCSIGSFNNVPTLEAQLNSGISVLEFPVTWTGTEWVVNILTTMNVNDSKPDTTLVYWLNTVKNWSASYSNHLPLVLVFEMTHDPSAVAHILQLNQFVFDTFGSQLFTLQDLQALGNKWPTVEGLLGRVILVLRGHSSFKLHYMGKGKQPAVATNESGAVVEVHTSQDQLYFWTGKRNLEGALRWSHTGYIGPGRKPAIAMNEEGYLLLVYEALTEDNMMYAVGKLLETGEVVWREPKQYDKGVTPAIALQPSGPYFVEVHRSQKNDNLWSHVGKISIIKTDNAESTALAHVEWGPSKKFVNQETGKEPTVKFSRTNPNHVEAIHRSHKTNKAWKWEADLNVETMTLNWDVKSHVQTTEQQYKRNSSVAEGKSVSVESKEDAIRWKTETNTGLLKPKQVFFVGMNYPQETNNWNEDMKKDVWFIQVKPDADLNYLSRFKNGKIVQVCHYNDNAMPSDPRLAPNIATADFPHQQQFHEMHHEMFTRYVRSM